MQDFKRYKTCVCDLTEAFCNLINMLVERNESGSERREEKRREEGDHFPSSLFIHHPADQVLQHSS